MSEPKKPHYCLYHTSFGRCFRRVKKGEQCWQHCPEKRRLRFRRKKEAMAAFSERVRKRKEKEASE